MTLSASSSGVKIAGESSPEAISSSAVAENAEDNDKSKEISSIAEASVVGNPTQLLNFETLISREKSTHQNHYSCDDGSSVALSRRVSSPCSSAFVVGNNQDLLSQILLFLPAKSLMRFQCVSKDWLSIISNPNFQRLHSRRSPGAEPGLLLLRQVQGKSEFNPVPLGKTELTSVSMIAARLDNLFNIEGEILGMHSCKGLFCIDFLPKNASRRFYVFNPITNQSRRIPWIDIEEKMDGILAVNICYDPLESDHYRLVCVWEKNIDEENFDRKFRFTVYSSETGVWKDYEWCGASCLQYYFQDGVFWNGIHCWTSKEWVILYFDFEGECVAHMWDDYDDGGGGGGAGNGAILYFGESGGNLWLITTGGISLEIWQLKVEVQGECRSYLCEWMPKYSLGLSFFRALDPLVANHMSNFDKHFSFYKPMQFGFRVPSFVVDEREEKPKIVISVPGKIGRYDIKDKTVEELVEIESADLQYVELIMSSFALNEAYKLVETLACV